MRRRTFDQLVELKLIRLGIDYTLDNLKEAINKLLTRSKELGKTYLGARLENIAENVKKSTNEMECTNQKLENYFDSMTDLILKE